MGFLTGKRAFIIGVANDSSIAFGIAKAMHREGAEIALTFQNERLERKVKICGEQVDCKILLPLDVNDDNAIDQAVAQLKTHWTDGLDILVHAVGFAPREELQGDYLSASTREGFKIAHETSAYSFVALAKATRDMLEQRQGSALTLTYLGAERVVPNYNVMGLAKASLEASVRYLAASLGPKGVRVNGISAGPIRTLASAGINDFKKMLKQNAQQSPLKRTVTQDEVGNTAAFLCSALASGITSEIIYVDAGYRNMTFTPEVE